MVMEIEDELRELKNLRPEERLKKLKELEEKRKSEIEDAEKLIKDTEGELSAQEEKKQKLPIPQIAAHSLFALQTTDEKLIFKMRRYIDENAQEAFPNLVPQPQRSLEEMAEEESKNLSVQIQPNMIYGAAIDQARQQPAYHTTTVTGFEKEEPKAKGFYESAKGFYEKPLSDQSDFYKQHTTTGAEEEAAQKRKKGGY